MADPSIVRVTTKQPPICQTYEYVTSPDNFTQRIVYYSTEPVDLWRLGDGQGRPFTISADPANPQLELAVSLNPDKSLQAGQPWKLEASLSINSFGSTIAFEPVQGKWDDNILKTNLTLRMIAPTWQSKEPIHLPWALTGTFNWKITGSASAKPDLAGEGESKPDLAGEGECAIELYVVSKHLAPCWKRDGIPAELLRFHSLLPQWMQEPRDPGLPLGWGSYVTHQLFHDNRMRYSSGCGQATYSAEDLGARNLLQSFLWIDLWLSDMDGIKTRGTNEQYAVNCTDMALLTIAISSLALPDDSSQMYLASIVDRFYIQEAFLVGIHQNPKSTRYAKIDKCNNPFFANVDKGDASKIKIPDIRNPKRTFFANHDFVVHGVPKPQQAIGVGKIVADFITQPRVLDSCAGPHLGSEDLEDYIKTAVDNDTAEWWSKKGVEDRPTKKIVDRSINFGNALEAMAPRPALVRGVSSDNLPPCLYKSMTELFREHPYKIMDPLEGFTNPQSISTVATWTVTQDLEVAQGTSPESGRSLAEYHINISRYLNLEEVTNEYERRKKNIGVKKSQEEPGKVPNGWRLTSGTSGFYMFWTPVDGTNQDEENAQYYLVVIDGDVNGDDIAGSIGQKLRAELEAFGSTANAKKVIAVESLTTSESVKQVQDGLKVKKDSDFSVTIKFNETFKPWWRGATAMPQQNRVILLSAAPNPGASEIEMRFRPLVAGEEKIFFSVFGLNLDNSAWARPQVNRLLKIKVVD